MLISVGFACLYRQGAAQLTCRCQPCMVTPMPSKASGLSLQVILTHTNTSSLDQCSTVALMGTEMTLFQGFCSDVGFCTASHEGD